MIQELLYTSYEGKGLRPGGGGGFCTVLSTAGMAANLAAVLEKLSGYKHPFDIHDPRSKSNPVNFRHAILFIGGVDYHVLSRIADVGHEHTGRTNKLAHHVALLHEDRVPIGPAGVLADSRVCRSQWNQKVAVVPPIAAASLPQGDLPNAACVAWQRAAGDAGWAGIVAETLLTNEKAVISVIYPLGTDCLALVNEVFSLIPPDRRWDVTFSTYYTAPLPNSTCQLRMLLDGMPEAEALRRDYRQKAIDLTATLGTAPDSDLVRAARRGGIQHPIRAAAPARRGRAAAAAANTATTVALEPLPPLGEPDGEFELAPLEGERRHAGPRYGEATRQPRRTYAQPAPKTPWKPMAIAALAACGLMMIFIAAGGAYMIAAAMTSKPPKETPVKEVVVKRKPREAKPKTFVDANDSGGGAPAEGQQEEGKDGAAPSGDAAQGSAEGGSSAGDRNSTKPEKTVDAGDTAATDDAAKPVNVATGGTKLLLPISALPDLEINLSPPVKATSIPSGPVQLAVVPNFTELKAVRVARIIGSDQLEGGNGEYWSVEPEADHRFNVVFHYEDLSPPKTSNDKKLGTLDVSSEHVAFTWDEKAVAKFAKAPSRLRMIRGLKNCAALFDLDGRKAVLPLARHDEIPVKIASFEGPMVLDFDSAFPRIDKLKLAARLDPPISDGGVPSSASKTQWSKAFHSTTPGLNQRLGEVRLELSPRNESSLQITTTTTLHTPTLPEIVAGKKPNVVRYKPVVIKSAVLLSQLQTDAQSDLARLSGVVKSAESQLEKWRKKKIDKENETEVADAIANWERTIASLNLANKFLVEQQSILNQLGSLTAHVTVEVQYAGDGIPAFPLFGVPASQQ